MANKMAEKNKRASQEMLPPKPKAKSVETTSVAKSQASKTMQHNAKAKPQAKRPSALQARLRANRFTRFILDAYLELRHKVTWPSVENARNMTIAVVLISAAIGAFLGLVDLGLSQLFFLIAGK